MKTKQDLEAQLADYTTTLSQCLSDNTPADTLKAIELIKSIDMAVFSNELTFLDALGIPWRSGSCDKYNKMSTDLLPLQTIMKSNLAVLSNSHRDAYNMYQYLLHPENIKDVFAKDLDVFLTNIITECIMALETLTKWLDKQN